jgi:hypothetical protein
MALEASLGGRRRGDEAAFQLFGSDVERTFRLLADALRGSAVAARDLPNLRERHDALVHSDASLSEPNTLTTVETDRITNSLNTLADQMFRLVGEESELSQSFFR